MMRPDAAAAGRVAAAAAPLCPEAPWRGPGSLLPLGSHLPANLVAIPHSGWMQGLRPGGGSREAMLGPEDGHWGQTSLV